MHCFFAEYDYYLKKGVFGNMVENFDKIVKDLDGGSAWQKVSDKKVPNVDEAKAYNIDLEA